MLKLIHRIIEFRERKTIRKYLEACRDFGDGVNNCSFKNRAEVSRKVGKYVKKIIEWGYEPIPLSDCIKYRKQGLPLDELFKRTQQNYT